MSRHHHDKSERREKSSSDRESHRRERRDRKERDPERKKHRRRGKFGSVMKSIMSAFLVLLHMITDKILELALSAYWGERKVCPAPSVASEIITKSAVELAKSIREKKLKSHDVVKAYIDRMQEVNGLLNAVADGPFLEALDEAKRIDERIEKGEVSEDEFAKKPFLGVPFTTKDTTAVGGKLHTCGLLSRRNTRAKEDAECIRLMKEAGGIVIATSTVPEVNKWVETRTILFGQTNNPYDSRRSVGGSSGGEGALISSCATAFGIGTDIGGSIRIPSFSCGIFGHKPTSGIINTKGCTFRTGKESSTMVVVGPMARYATDLLPIFRILVEPQNVSFLKLDEPVEVKKLKYYYVPSNGMAKCNPISKESEAVMFKTIRYFSDLTGEKVVLASLPALEATASMWRYWMTQEPNAMTFNQMLGNGASVNPFVELAKVLIGRGEFTMAAIYGMIDDYLPKENAALAQELTRKCDEALTELLGDDGVLFYHSSPRTTPFHYYPLIKFNDFHYFSIFNALKVPATQVPMGLDQNGIPLGIQVVATRNRDRHCLAVAEELERAFGGWVPPFESRN